MDVPAAELLQTCRCQGLQRAVKPYPQMGQQFESGVVAYQPFYIPKDAPENAKKAHAHNGQLQFGNGRVQCSFGNNVGGSHHQSYAAANGQKSHQGAEEHPVEMLAKQQNQANERMAFHARPPECISCRYRDGWLRSSWGLPSSTT